MNISGEVIGALSVLIMALVDLYDGFCPYLKSPSSYPNLYIDQDQMDLLHVLGGLAGLVEGDHHSVREQVCVCGLETGCKILMLRGVDHEAVLAVVRQDHGDHH